MSSKNLIKKGFEFLFERTDKGKIFRKVKNKNIRPLYSPNNLICLYLKDGKITYFGKDDEVEAAEQDTEFFLTPIAIY